MLEAARRPGRRQGSRSGRAQDRGDRADPAGLSGGAGRAPNDCWTCNRAGATVLRGQMGFGRHSVVRAAKRIDTSPSMPAVIEVVDDETRIREFLVAIDPMLTEGLVTLEKVHLYKHPGGGE